MFDSASSCYPRSIVKILHRYVFREILLPFAFGLGVFTFVLLVARLLKLIELVVSRGLPLASIMRLFAYIMPAFLEVTVPMAMLLAILIAFGRLSADSEMVALRSSGLSLYQLMPPVVIFVALATSATAGIALYARPWGNRSLKTALYDMARTRASAGLKPAVFNDDFPGLVIYAEGIDPTMDRLAHVLIADERDPQQHNTIFARAGFMISDRRAQTVTLRLLEGSIHTTDPRGGAEYQTDFQSYDVNLDLRQAFAGLRQRERDPKELTLGQLARSIAAKQAAGRPYGPELVEYHRKFSIPFACIVFGLVAVPLGVQPARAVRARGFVVSLVVIFAYYIFLSAGQTLAERGVMSAAFGLWLPNLVLAALGSYLFAQAARERTAMRLERVQVGLAALRQKVVARLGAEA
ncbi:MAG: LPS export ABC transporter permease LptF [Deltaproteobacteria bacterium]|nr:MAG: LPS export ABC transporter permease LptF [Deltaproteobacteria bacterium]